MRQSSRLDWAMSDEAFYFSVEDRQSDVWVMDVVRR